MIRGIVAGVLSFVGLGALYGLVVTPFLFDLITGAITDETLGQVLAVGVILAIGLAIGWFFVFPVAIIVSGLIGAVIAALLDR